MRIRIRTMTQKWHVLYPASILFGRLTFKGLELWKGDAPLFGLVQNTTEQMKRFLVIILWRQKSKIPIAKMKTIFRKVPYQRTAYAVSTYKCCGSMTFWCRSRSGSADPCLWLMDPDSDPVIYVIHHQGANKKLIKKKFFCLLLFEGTFASYFEDKKSKRSRKTVGIKVFLPIFAWWQKDPEPDPYL